MKSVNIINKMNRSQYQEYYQWTVLILVDYGFVEPLISNYIFFLYVGSALSYVSAHVHFNKFLIHSPHHGVERKMKWSFYSSGTSYQVLHLYHVSQLYVWLIEQRNIIMFTCRPIDIHYFWFYSSNTCFRLC